MNLAALSLENAPGFRTPVRFFLTVPVFGIVAALVLLFSGVSLSGSRWLDTSLAVTHALTLGYIAMAMLGALFQMLPVVMGAFLPRAERFAVVAHLALSGGTLCLVFAFLLRQPVLFIAAMLLLVPTLVLFGAGVIFAIQRAGKPRSTGRIARLAAVALIVTVLAGASLASGHAFDDIPLHRELTNIHAAWGVAGWILVLVTGISEQVIPMFLTTPPYPRHFNSRLATWLVALLVAGSLLPGHAIAVAGVILASTLMLAYAGVTLHLLARRRRKRTDVTGWFWRLGMLCLITGALTNLYAMSGGVPAGLDLSMLSGVLLIAGFAVSLINGMLYKIVPFLVWLNLRMPAVTGKLEPGARYYTPNIHEVIDIRPMKLQFAFHLAGLLLLTASVFPAGVPVYAGAAAMLVSNLLLLSSLVHAARLYQRYSSRIIAPS